MKEKSLLFAGLCAISLNLNVWEAQAVNTGITPINVDSRANDMPSYFEKIDRVRRLDRTNFENLAIFASWKQENNSKE